MKLFRQHDPYQIFFPFAFLFGLVGVGVWILFSLQNISLYPRAFHADVMIGGFFLGGVIGFLLTAIPKFTDTMSASPKEKQVFFLLFLFLFLSAFLPSPLLFHLFLLGNYFALFVFAKKRFQQKKVKLPPAFVFVGAGMASALVSVVLLVVNDIFPLASQLLRFAQILFWYGTFFGFALGVGTKLLPSIMGISRVNPAMLHAGHPFLSTSLDEKLKKIQLVYVVLLYASFAVEAFFSSGLGKILRALLLSWIVLFEWRIYLFPKSKGILSKCLWLSSWMFALGSWPAVFWTQYSVHFNHIIFIGALSLMFFAVATRVTLSHGGHDQQLEVKSKALWFMLVLFFIAMITRVTAHMLSDLYVSHLAYAAIAWIIGCLIWACVFLSKVIVRSKCHQ